MCLSMYARSCEDPELMREATTSFCCSPLSLLSAEFAAY